MGSVFDNLTKAGVSQNGKNTYYNTPAEATQALATKSAPLAQPDNYTFGGTVPALPEPVDTPETRYAMLNARTETPGGGTDSVPSIAPASLVTASKTSPTIPGSSVPRMATVTPDTPLTTKGEILKMVLQGMIGAGAGAGSRTVGDATVRGIQANENIEDQARKRRAAMLDEQLKQAQIENIPIVQMQRQAELERTKSQTKLDQAKANRGDFMYTKNGILRIGPHDDLSIVPGTEPNEKPDLAETESGRAQLIAKWKQEYGKDYALTPRDEQNFRATGKLPAGDGEKMSAVELAMRAESDPDPKKRQMYQNALTRYGNATRPNYAGTNQENSDSRKNTASGNAQILASKALAKAGNDPQKAIQMIDSFVSAGNLTAEQAAIAADARKSLLNQFKATKTNKKADPVASILNEVLQPTN